jgi:uncharacterized protein (TIGR02246 family)
MENDEQQIRELVQNWMAATKAGDTQTVLDMMADDVVFLVAGRPPMTKEAFAASAEQSKAGRIEIDGLSEIQEVKLLGDWAFLWTKLRVVARPPGGAPPIVRTGYTLSVLKKQRGKWVLARDANMLPPVSDQRSSMIVSSESAGIL